VYRWSDLDFEANAKEGVGVDWPIRYADIAPWYDHVERFIGVSGQAEGLAQLPDGQFLPPMEMRCAERSVREKVLAKWGGERVLTIGRVAILTRNHNGRAACHYCGPCERGCITHSYFTSIGSTLPAARRTGRLTLRPNSVVHSLIYDASRDRASGVRVIDAVTMQPLEFRARIVFVCASTMESARVLLNSKSDRFSTGLGNSSGQLGRNLMDHAYGAGAGGTIPGMEEQTSFGRRPNGIYIARFRNVKDKHPDFLRGYGFQGGAGRNGPPRPSTGFGPEFKRALVQQRAGPVDLLDQRVGRVSAARGQPDRAASDAGRQVGHPGAEGRLHLGSERAGAAGGHAGHRSGNAGRGRREGHPDPRLEQSSGALHP
jgi:choline dehydrogenase-like flavoprotein